MRRSTKRLMDEHELILQTIDSMGTMADSASARGEVDEPFWRDAIDFIRNFADGLHHQKEEGQLFEMYSRRWLSREYGPVAVMLNEHVMGRDCVSRMEAAVANQSPDQLARAARDYCELLTQHIAKENQILFPLGETVLSDSDEIELNIRFDEAELELGGTSNTLRYRELAASLAEHAAFVARGDPKQVNT